MNNITSGPQISFEELKYRCYAPIKTVEAQLNRALKVIQFKFVDDLPMIIWFVSSSL